MGIGTFGAFTQARLGIYAATTGLNVTGNNITNINTKGYTRQRLDQVSLYTAGADRYYAEGDIRVGQGPLVKSLSQIRSPYLDIRYRTENTKLGYYDSTLEGLDAIAAVLDEVGKGDKDKDEEGFGVLGMEIHELFTALANITDQTGHDEYDNTVRATASNLITKLHSYAGQLERIQKETIVDFKQDLEAVNNHLTNIRSLNEEIRKCEIHGDSALELRDERNVQIDELSRLIDINVTYGEEEIAGGLIVEKLTITLDNANPDKSVKTDESLLVDGIFAAQMYLGTPVLNPDYDEEALPYLDLTDPANPVPTDDEAFKDNPNPASKKYLKVDEWNEDGTIKTSTPVDDLRDATILTEDEDNPNFNLMITELKNKQGDLHIDSNVYAAEAVNSVPAGITFNFRTNRASVTEEDKPAPGDKTVTLYWRSQKLDANGKPVYEADGKTPVYNYTKQVYEQLVSKPVALDDNDLSGEIQGERELLTEKGEFCDLEAIDKVDEDAASKRGIQYYQKALDLLANQFAKVFNEANQGFRVDPKGNYITTGKNDQGKEIAVPVTVTAGGVTHTLNKDDTLSKMDPAIAEELVKQTGIAYNMAEDNSKEIIDAYLKGPDYDPDDPLSEDWKETARGIFDGGVLFSNDGDNNDPTGITAANISISRTWQDNHILVRDFKCPEDKTEPASGASDNLVHFQYILDGAKWEYIPNALEETEPKKTSGDVMFEGTIFEMWNQIGSTLGHDQDVNTVMRDTAYQTALSVDTDRDSVSSVDFNDEAMNLMMYAKSYNAACRLMTTIDSVLDKLINNTGMTT